MNITVNGKALSIDTTSGAFTIANLLEHLKINPRIARVVVEKNGDLADNWKKVDNGDVIQIKILIGGG